MFQKRPPPDAESSGEYIIDFVTDSGKIRARLFKQPIGTVAHVYLESDSDMALGDGEPFFGPIHAYLTSKGLPRLTFMHMHYAE